MREHYRFVGVCGAVYQLVRFKFVVPIFYKLPLRTEKGIKGPQLLFEVPRMIFYFSLSQFKFRVHIILCYVLLVHK